MVASIKLVTYRIDKIIPLFKLLSEFAIAFNGVFVLATLKPVIFNDGSDLSLEFASDM
jgi:hypothetical protein